MAVDFFSSDVRTIGERLDASFSAATDADGRPLFPDHRVPGTPGYNLRSLFAGQLASLYRDLNTALAAQSPLTATGTDLDRWAQYFGLTRGAVRYASGEVVIESRTLGADLERLLGTRQIGEGTALVFEGAAGTRVRLTTAAPCEIPPGGREVVVVVASADPLLRLSRGTPFTVEAGLLRTELTARAVTDIAGGQLAEADSELRYRVVRALLSPSTYEGFRTRIETHADVATVELSENVYGPGTLEAFVVPATPLPSRTLREELEALWPGAGGLYVLFPDYEAVQLRIRLSGTTSASPQAVADLINNLPPGATLVLNAVEALLQTNGAADAQVIGLRRGLVDADGDAVDVTELTQATNLTPRGPRAKWHCRPAWVTFCQG